MDQISCINSANVGQMGKGTYCYTYDGFTCYTDYGPNCDINTGYLCATLDGVNLYNLSYCVSYDSQNCYSDLGQLCSSTNLVNCNISRLTPTCPNQNSINCFTFGIGWRFTQDGLTTYKLSFSNLKFGTYCFSSDTIKCDITQLNILRQGSYQCLTNDNVTCYKDLGERTNSSRHLNWGNIAYNSQSCRTLDMSYCISGLWIKTQSAQSGNTTFCYSVDGKQCKKYIGGVDCQKGNSLSSYLCQYQKDSKGNYLRSLKTLTQCLSYDRKTCYSDLQSSCGDTPQSSYCSINDTNNFCQTTDNQICSYLAPGIYFTYDGISISSIYPQQLNQQGLYCYSSNGVFCDYNSGPLCSSFDGSNCVTIDRVNIVSAIQCLIEPRDYRICQQDAGSQCNPSQNNFDGTCGLTNNNFCFSIDQGQTCLLQNIGWYFTLDGQNLYKKQDTQGQKGTYCYSDNGQTCNVIYDQNCNSIKNKSQCLNTTKCLSFDNIKCFNDTGSLCNSSSLMNVCNIQLQTNNCSSQLYNGTNCYIKVIQNQNQQSNLNLSYNNAIQSVLTIQNLWCFSIDVLNCYDKADYPQVQEGFYCQTQDGYQCIRDFGPNCNQNTGYLCTTSDRVNLAQVSYCATNDNLTCVRDLGQYCITSINTYCQIPQKQIICISMDGRNCYDFIKRWYFTLDTFNVYQGIINYNLNGFYCYSIDGIQCVSSWNSFISFQISNCISQNNQTCYQDQGQLCNSPKGINYCSIINYTNWCSPLDRSTCSNLNWIKMTNSDSLCYSIDGKGCFVSIGGLNCKYQYSDYLCSIQNGVLQNLTICLSYDFKKCYKCQNTNYKQCFKQGDQQNYCNTLDGINCFQLSSGWYFTFDGLTVNPIPNKTLSLPKSGGFYCQSDNSYKCSLSFGPQCNLNDGSQCAMDIHLGLISVTKCLSQNLQQCYQDVGQLCAPIRKQNPGGSCDLQVSQNSCSTVNSDSTASCYDYISGWYFSLDGFDVNQVQYSIQLGTYCFSNNGKKCKYNYGGFCNLNTGYGCSTSDQINLIQTSFCITSDNINCYQDTGKLCNKTNLQGRCMIFNDTLFCETQNGKNCYQNKIGWYATYDGLNVGINLLNNNKLRSYCYSYDGYICKQNYGPSCNLQTGSFCTTSDGINLQNITYCISFNNQTCFQDQGKLCNYTGNQAWCNIYNQTANCPTQDGINCYDFQQGWYFTTDLINVVKSVQLNNTTGYYCYSTNAKTCYSDQGANCDPNTGYLCSTSDGITLQPINYCITDNNQNCKQDYGQFCNYTGNLLWCNIYTYSKSCMTMFQSGQCFSLQQRYYMTYDAVNVNKLAQGLIGYLANYCYSYDGQQCYQDYGFACNLLSGVFCSTSNGANLTLGSYCVSADNLTCFRDIGQLCNNSNQLNWCRIYNNTNSCFTQDGFNCFNFYSQYCLTFDGQNCNTNPQSTRKGFYCWSNDGNQCSQNGVPRCDSSQRICSTNQGIFCITQDYQTCLEDTGYFCNSSYSLLSCNINYDLSQFCLSYDNINCVNVTNLQLLNQPQVSIERSNLRQYFFYAINTYNDKQNIYNTSSIGYCRPDCNKIKNFCCVSVQKQTEQGLIILDYFCMNQYVVLNKINFNLNGNIYALSCVDFTNQNTEASTLKYFKSLSILIIIFFTIY